MKINSQRSLIKLLKSSSPKTFRVFNFGCRVNAAEINQLSQFFINYGFTPSLVDNPQIILINTCAVTRKGENESLTKIRVLQKQYPQSLIIATGCANLNKIQNILTIGNILKDNILTNANGYYSPRIGDKYTPHKRYLLRVQSGCTQKCSYCIVPQKRPHLWSLAPSTAVATIKKIEAEYNEIIITGVNLAQYQYGLTDLVKKIIEETKIKLISFGSIPLNCFNDEFLNLLDNKRIVKFLHIPIQSGSNRILKLMRRPYNQKKIINVFESLKSKIKNLSLGTDIIVGFPTETKADFQKTYNLCRKIGFKKIHTFRFSPRPNTEAQKLFDQNPKINKTELKSRSIKIRNLVNY